MEAPVLVDEVAGDQGAWWPLPATNDILRVPRSLDQFGGLRSGRDEANAGSGCQVERGSVKASTCRVL